jgi:hypothetical protein
VIGSKSCSCLGENPNCFRCDGTGFYDVDESSTKVAYSESIQTVNRLPSIRDEYTPKRKVIQTVKATEVNGQLVYKTTYSYQHVNQQRKTKLSSNVMQHGVSHQIPRKAKNEKKPKQDTKRETVRPSTVFDINQLNKGVQFKPMVTVFMDQFIKKHAIRICKLTRFFKDHAVFDYNGLDVFFEIKEEHRLELNANYEVILVKKHGHLQYEVALTLEQQELLHSRSDENIATHQKPNIQINDQQTQKQCKGRSGEPNKRQPGCLTQREQALNRKTSSTTKVSEPKLLKHVTQLAGYHKHQESLWDYVLESDHHSPARKSSHNNSAVTGFSQDRQLDGSRQYSDFARENGRFGSMPSYDAMDDESFA